jgi:hypothetical protein
MVPICGGSGGWKSWFCGGVDMAGGGFDYAVVMVVAEVVG